MSLDSNEICSFISWQENCSTNPLFKHQNKTIQNFYIRVNLANFELNRNIYIYLHYISVESVTLYFINSTKFIYFQRIIFFCCLNTREICMYMYVYAQFIQLWTNFIQIVL